MTEGLVLTASLIGVGLLVGVMSAMFGVGGGVLMVPFLVFAVGVTQHTAEGTSLLVIVPTAFAGALAHRRRGYVLVRPAVMVAILGVPGAFFGARLALALDATNLQRVFGVFVVLVGIRLIAQSRGKSATAGFAPES